MHVNIIILQHGELKNEMGAAGSTYGVEESCIQGFDEETWGKETT